MLTYILYTWYTCTILFHQFAAKPQATSTDASLSLHQQNILCSPADISLQISQLGTVLLEVQCTAGGVGCSCLGMGLCMFTGPTTNK